MLPMSEERIKYYEDQSRNEPKAKPIENEVCACVLHFMVPVSLTVLHKACTECKTFGQALCSQEIRTKLILRG